MAVQVSTCTLANMHAHPSVSSVKCFSLSNNKEEDIHVDSPDTEVY